MSMFKKLRLWHRHKWVVVDVKQYIDTSWDYETPMTKGLSRCGECGECKTEDMQLHWTLEQLNKQVCAHKWKVTNAQQCPCETPTWKGPGTNVLYVCGKCGDNRQELVQGSWTITHLQGKDVLEEFDEFMENVNPSDFVRD